MPIRKYTWKRDRPDIRDLLHDAQPLQDENLPALVDLRAKCPPVYDQGELGSCTANAIGAAYQFDEIKQGNLNGDAQPSRLFIYYNERVLEGTVYEDSGAEIRDSVRSIAQFGVCPEKDWPYLVEQFTVRPPESCYQSAKEHRAVLYKRVPQVLANIKSVLASGLPVAFGFNVFSSFESQEVAKTGIMPMPQLNEQCLGGHAVLAVGYDDSKQAIIVRNSWGATWGDGGYFYMPYQFILNPSLASDFWTVQKIC
ncbi:MAG: C1 family peptidase [Sulfobacillus sp.]